MVRYISCLKQRCWSSIKNCRSENFWKSVFPDALPASALEGEGIVQLTQVVRDQMLGQTLRSKIKVPLADSKGITFIEKFSNVQVRDYETHEDGVLITTDVSQRILDQLANNVPSAKVLKSVASPLSKKKPWRCRTKAIKELIPDGFLEPVVQDNEIEVPGRTGITVGKRRLSPRNGSRKRNLP